MSFPAIPESSAPTRALDSPLPVYSGPFGIAQAKRLFWRAGFGPAPGQARALAKLPLKRAVLALTRPDGTARMHGPAPTDGNGNPITPYDAWAHDHLYWLDRMVRTNQPLKERMALVWHDWFATSIQGVDTQRHMIEQYELFRSQALGSFRALLLAVTTNPAMLQWLNGIENEKDYPNENYGREVQELFTLGADRGAYTEDDVREMARALTGWTADWSDGIGYVNFRFSTYRHDKGMKTIYGQTGAYDWQDACQLILDHPLHPSYLVPKLWSYFIPTPPSDPDRAKLEQLYIESGYKSRPLVEAILLHPDLYEGPAMVKPPVVFTAGLLRALERFIDTDAWTWLAELAGQRLFDPPNVAGWDDTRWLDTSTTRGRWLCVYYALDPSRLTGNQMSNYDASETSAAGLDTALAFCNKPPLSDATRGAMLDFANRCVGGTLAPWQQREYRGLRQNALRQLVLASPDAQTA